MAVTTTNLGFAPKGRPTIRKNTPSNRTPRYIEPWALRPKAGTTLPSRRAGSALKRNALLCPQGYEDGGWPAKVEIDRCLPAPASAGLFLGRINPAPTAPAVPHSGHLLRSRYSRSYAWSSERRRGPLLSSATRPMHSFDTEGLPSPRVQDGARRHQCQSVRPRRTAAASRPIGSRALALRGGEAGSGGRLGQWQPRVALRPNNAILAPASPRAGGIR